MQCSVGPRLDVVQNVNHYKNNNKHLKNLWHDLIHNESYDFASFGSMVVSDSITYFTAKYVSDSLKYFVASYVSNSLKYLVAKYVSDSLKCFIANYVSDSLKYFIAKNDGFRHPAKI